MPVFAQQPIGLLVAAFRQVTLLFEEVVNNQAYEALCQAMLSTVIMQPEFVSPPELVAEPEQRWRRCCYLWAASLSVTRCLKR